MSPTPKPTPSFPWQICALDIFTLDGVDYIILANFYSKIILVHKLPAGQSNCAKVIHIPEEWFCDPGTLEVLHTDNGPQYASAAFADYSIEWGFTHESSSPHYLQSNEFTKSFVKIVKHMINWLLYAENKAIISYYSRQAFAASWDLTENVKLHK